MNQTINPEYVPEPEKVNVKKGLEGAVVDTTAISKVTPETNSLIYRGYRVQDLADHCSFEEVVYLLWNGELPTGEQKKEFEKQERSLRNLDTSSALKVLENHLVNKHPMDVVRTGVSLFGCEDDGNLNHQNDRQRALSLLAKIPTLVAAHYRFTQGKKPIPPNPQLSYVENFFHMCFEKLPHPRIMKAFEASLVLYAEHSFNASTFTARVIASTESDFYSAITGAIGALKGPLHGGANEAVMHMMIEIGEPSKAETWIREALAQKKKIMGFGHRVYKYGDSRVPTMRKYAEELAEITGQKKWMEIYKILERVMLETKRIHPTLDFPAGPAYYMMGFDIPFFTPFFVMSRVSGWSAHIFEQLANNRIIRPLSEYIGPAERSLSR